MLGMRRACARWVFYQESRERAGGIGGEGWSAEPVAWVGESTFLVRIEEYASSEDHEWTLNMCCQA